MTPLEAVPFNAPKQDRSRASFERVLEAAVVLLQERGYEGFTLQEVSRRSRTSIGSIYCRVKGKDELFRAVQVHVLERRDTEMETILNPAKWEGLEPAKLLHFLVREVGEYLRRHGPSLRAFIAHERRDPIVRQTGRQSHARLAELFQRILLLHASQFNHPRPEQAADFCFNLTFSMLARQLDLDAISQEGSNWNQLLDDIGHILCLYLLGPDLTSDRTSDRSSDRTSDRSGDAQSQPVAKAVAADAHGGASDHEAKALSA